MYVCEVHESISQIFMNVLYRMWPNNMYVWGDLLCENKEKAQNKGFFICLIFKRFFKFGSLWINPLTYNYGHSP